MIRKAHIADATAIAECRRQAVLAIDRKFYTEEQISAWADAQMPEKFLDPIRNGEIFLIDDSGSISAFGWIKNDPAEIRAIYVSPQYQGRGLGATLLKFLENELRVSGVTEIMLGASLNAESFYAKHRYLAGPADVLDVGGVLSPYIPMTKRMG